MHAHRSAALAFVVFMTGSMISCGGTADTTSPPPTPTTASISGKVLDADSALGGVRGATITLSGAGSSTVTTQATGDFLASSLEPGAYTLTLTAPTGYVIPSSESGTRNVTVVASNSATPVMAFQLARARGSVAGSITANGSALATGSVTLARPGFGSRTAATDANGTYSFDAVPVGTWTASVAVPGTLMLGTNETGIRTVSVNVGQSSQVSAFTLVNRPVETATIIHVAGSSFTPANLTVTAGTTVKWMNDDGGSHTITPQNASQPGVFARTTFGGSTGVVLTHTFSIPGQVYHYRCEIHSTDFDSGMVGTITVQ